jgi:hypothetical protein
MATSMADKAAKIMCMRDTLKGLSDADLYALHVLKHEVVGGIFRLYAKVSPDKADKVLTEFFDTLVKQVQAEVAAAEAARNRGGGGGGGGGVDR